MARGELQRRLAFLLTGQDVSASKAMRGVKKEILTLQGVSAKAGTNIAKNLKRGMLLAGTAAVGALGFAIKAAGDFEAQLNTINTVARESPEALGKIGEGIRKVSRDTGTPIEDLTAGYYDLVSAGIAAADAQGVLEHATALSIGGISTNAEAVDLLTTAINTYGGDASKAGQFTDEFAKAIERGKVTAADLAASYATVGPLAASLNIENAELAAGYARLTAGGTAAGEASTQMASAMTALLKKTAGLKALEKQTGKNYAAIAGSQGLNVALEQMRQDADKAGIELINLVGRKEALLYILQTTGPNMAAYNADLAAMGDSAGTAAGQMAERQKGLNAQIALLRANLHDAAITIGTEVLPEFAALAREGTDWIRAHQPEIAQFAKDLATGIRDAVKAAKGLDWAMIGNSLKLAGQGAKAVLDVFMGMPDWVKAAVLTGWGLNKLTGGAVIDFGKMTIQGLRGATPATAMWVKVAGGLPGATGGTGGGLGKVGGALSILGTLAGILAVVETDAGNQAQTADQTKTVAKNLRDFLATDPTRRQIEDMIRTQEQIRDNMDPFQRLAFESNYTGVKSIFEGGLAELRRALLTAPATSTRSTLLGSEPDRAAMSAAISAALGTDYRQRIRERAEVARGGGGRLATIRGGGQDAATVAEYVVGRFAQSQAPFYRNTANMTSYLAAIKTAQEKAVREGDTVVATELGNLATRLEAAIRTETSKGTAAFTTQAGHITAASRESAGRTVTASRGIESAVRSKNWAPTVQVTAPLSFSFLPVIRIDPRRVVAQTTTTRLIARSPTQRIID